MHALHETTALRAARAGPKIGLVVCSVDWHARALARGFAAHGAAMTPVRLAACGLSASAPSGIVIAGFTAVPDAIMVRDMAGGTFEAVTLRLGILHAAREAGVLVWNDARAIERCVDKSMTSFLLWRAGVPTLPAWAVESRDEACAIVAREPGPLVLKPLFGSQGRGLRLVTAPADLPTPDAVRGVYYLQRFACGGGDGGFCDFRLLVSRGRVVAAMARHSPHWITNVKQGGRPVAVAPTAQMTDLAVTAAAAVGASFAGVDIIGGDDGALTVLEVNSMPAWSGLQKVTPFDIAATLASDLVAAAGARAGLPA
jgi:RimK family alpha-L-glutamate ligase